MIHFCSVRDNSIVSMAALIAQKTTPGDRLCRVTAASVVQYACALHRRET
jgi:carbonic anhydrase/acetyltransferase-like protein (isoleucine patch superfamily)